MEEHQRLDQILHELTELVEKTSPDAADLLSDTLDGVLTSVREALAAENPQTQLTPAEVEEIEARDEARRVEDAEMTEEKIQNASMARRGLGLQDAKAFFAHPPELTPEEIDRRQQAVIDELHPIEDDDARAQADVPVQWSEEPK